MPVRSVFPLPLTIEAIDRDWLTAALRVNSPGATVLAFEVIDVFAATSTSARLKLELDEAGKQAGIPDTVIVKGGFQEHSRHLAPMHKLETLGYRDLLPGAGLNSPECYFADWDEANLHGIVIMEDLNRRGGKFGHLRVTRSRDEVAYGVALLARYHSGTWGCRTYPPAHRLAWVRQEPLLETQTYMEYLEPESYAKFIALPRAAAASTYFQDREWVIDTRRRLLALTERADSCILHGDANPGNVFFQDDGKVAFFDIVPRVGPAMMEVAYHITLSLDPIDRPRFERELVHHYLEVLRRHGVEPPGFDEAMFQYGAFLCESLIMCMLNPPVVTEDKIVAPVARLSAAMVDHDSVRLIASVD